MIPLEIAISILLLMWALPVNVGKAFALAALTRSAAFVLTLSLTETIRHWIKS